MTQTDIIKIFAKDRPWLELQQGMLPWEEGCRVLVGSMNDWLAEYSAALCSAEVTPQQPGYPEYIERLWRCWRHHWKGAIAVAGSDRFNGLEVAHKIRDGKGYVGAGRLGGDPLRDVVLAQAVLERDSRAADYFLETFRSFAIGMARRQDPHFAPDPDQWWYDFFLHFLAGYDRSPLDATRGKLARFDGGCGVRNWLGTVVRRHVWRKLKARDRHRELPTSEIEEGQERSERRAPTQPGPDLQECRSLFEELANDSLSGLNATDRTVLGMIFRDGDLQKKVAEHLDIAGGNVTRAKERAIRRLREALEQNAVGSDRERAYRDCTELMMQQRNALYFADVLFLALKGLDEEATQ